VFAPGESAVGFTWRSERSPYEGSDRNSDLLPYVLYDSRYFYLQSNRIGLKLENESARGELFLRRRFDGFSTDRVPESMVGLDKRFAGDDLGVAARVRLGAGAVYAEAMRDVSDKSRGTELRLGYRYEGWWSGNLRWRPYVTAAWRDSKLNDYYFGTPDYSPGAGLNLELGLLAAYRFTQRWQLLAGVGATRWASAVRDSPVVRDDAVTPYATIGLAYGFMPDEPNEWERRPLIVRLGYGHSTDCDLLPILNWGCTSRHTQDDTGTAHFELGQVLVKRVNGWPLDLAGFIGLVRHKEAGLQEDFWQVNAYLKPYYYFGPWWRERLRTRLGFGAGIAYASNIPFSEQRDQAIRGRDTSKLLLYLDPTIDINVGDLFRAQSLRETYFGIGVSHRSGIFGSSRLFNSVNGGSNYMYVFVESGF
jgi:outer membrane protein